MNIEAGLPQAMRQGVLVDFLQVTMPVVTMDGERSFSHKITQFVYRAHNSISPQLVSGSGHLLKIPNLSNIKLTCYYCLDSVFHSEHLNQRRAIDGSLGGSKYGPSFAFFAIFRG
jgi:hypothetical protein